MENITHAFVGAAMAECAVPRGASARTRAVFMCAGVIAANAPDIDLLYTGINEAPLGYLLHHRGHSHTLPGLIALGVVLWAGLRLLPWIKSGVLGAERRWILLIAAALLSHVLMDASNGYGTHLFYPFTARWFYGDAVFVLGPWLWVLLGTALALNATRFWRVVPGFLMLGPLVALVALGLLPVGILLAMLAVAGGLAFMARGWERRRRAMTALVAVAMVFVVMPGVSRAAKAEARRATLGLDRGDVIDIVSDANPGVPWCWSVLTLQKAVDGSREVLVARRGTLSLVPGVWPAASCRSARLHERWTLAEGVASDGMVWHRRWQIDVEELRALYAGNCRVRAWLQFGRIPHVANGSIADLRFEHPIGQNFTPMAVATASGSCPAYGTNWEPPRRDILLTD